MLVAGGTGSIGIAIAEHALHAGWAVVVHGSSEVSTATAFESLRAVFGMNVAVYPLAADVKIEGAVAELVERAGAWRDRLDAVVDCVSTGPQKRLTGVFEETDDSGFAALMECSVIHTQRLAYAALPWLKRQRGTFIAFASDAGRFAAPRQTLIGASRAAIMGFVRNLAVEVARGGVRVHCISPGFVDETKTAERLAAHGAERIVRARDKAGLGLPTPTDIAPLVMFLCGHGAEKITGQIISVNGGANA